MKANGNDKRVEKYYIGLDVGTGSVGWAATHRCYTLLKFHGKEMWGARLFESAHTAEERGNNRRARRRLERTKQRLVLLELLFNNEISKVDRNFFRRMHDSNLWLEDKEDKSCKYSLFDDANYNDTNYLNDYPTIYHLRSELIHSKEPHDIRLVFLAIHHILKSRGHFLYESSDEAAGKNLDELLTSFEEYCKENEIAFSLDNKTSFVKALLKEEGKNAKKKTLKDAYGKIESEADDKVDINSLVELFSGAKIDFSKLFNNDNLKDATIKGISLLDDLDENYDSLSEILDDDVELLFKAKEVVDTARLNKLLGNNEYISDAKIELFNQNKKDLQLLKAFVKENYDIKKYNKIFNYDSTNTKLNNFAKYTGYKINGQCTQEELCKFLKSEVKEMKSSEDVEVRKVYEKIEDGSFYAKLKGSENGLIPYQLHLKELKTILNNASSYLHFLKAPQEDGITVYDKIISIFTFRIPYYVGPLNTNSDKAFVSRKPGKVYPWNFDYIVDKKASAENFMKKLIGRCTYTGDEVLPFNSLIYSEYLVLNEINKIKVNGNPIDSSTKMEIFNALFVESKQKVTKKKIKQFLMQIGKCPETDEISGVDNDIKATLKSYHDLKNIIAKTSKEDADRIIERIVVYGDDKKMLKEWIEANYPTLDENDIKQIQRLKYKDWGRLSKTFLTEIYEVDKETHEAVSILGMLRNTNCNLMELLSNKYQFAKKAKEYKIENYGCKESITDRLDEMYIAPSVKRSIWQTLKIVDEIVDIEKGAPEKIFIEMARTSSKEMKGKITESRKDKLMSLYEDCKKQANDLFDNELFEKLKGETNESLRREKLFLYYTQMGRCMYSWEPIDLNKLLNDNETYDIDHIFPRSRIKDNSIDNKVLVKSVLNRDKTNVYPISDDVRTKMFKYWSLLHDKHLISDKKYERLKRSTPLTEEELSSFIARQIVETQQSTKALATILGELYPNTKIVYSKAGNVSDFRQEFQIPKFRDINDLHHAKDAYLNIVVGNVYATKFTDKFFKNIENENYSLNRVFDYDVEGAWTAPKKDEMKAYRKAEKEGDIQRLSGTLQTVYKYVFKNTPLVTTAPFEQKGTLFKIQILSAGNGQLEIKQGLPISKYGGYTKLTGAYFSVIEHTLKGKRVRSIFPVYLYKKQEFENNPIAYAENTLILIEPKIILKKIYFHSSLEIDGERLIITGRTGNLIVYYHTYQLDIDNEKSKYLKELKKYIDKHKKGDKPLPLNPRSHISKSENEKLYDWFIEKSEVPIYNDILNNLRQNLIKCKEHFRKSDVLIQSKVLLQILNAFKCNPNTTDLKEIGGPSTTARISKNKDLNKFKSVYLVNSSSTGLFETKINLLED